MSQLFQRIRKFVKSEDGPTAVEYAVMVALIAVAIITAVTTLGDQVKAVFNDAETQLKTVE